jgi:hypothetical protein
MRTTAVLPVEGILRKPIGGLVNEGGLALFRALSAEYSIILVTQEAAHARINEWLEKENILRYDDILYGDLCLLSTETYWANMIRILRTRGYNLGLVLVNSPEDALEVLACHVPVLMYSQPAYGLPEWLPGSRRGAERWSELSAKVESDRRAKLDDKRMEPSE